MKYRTDIDGLRALAVVAVILFHLGFLPNGYLGVDVFFVISGYLITSIVYGRSEKGKFSIIDFYERRIRRIIPLLLVVSTVAFLLGLVYMLPDDLENLCQSVVASNVSANNILMYLTSADYWAVKNDYKPLMHTWSLGIEEQFYLLYPFLFYAMGGPRLKYVKHVLIALTALSLGAFLLQDSVAATFYFIQYRFFELAIGGLGAILFSKVVIERHEQGRMVLYGLLGLITLILFLPIIPTNELRVLLTTMITVGILIIGKQYFESDRLYAGLMANPAVAFIGNISFSLYMWHQLLFAFARYAFLEEITPGWAIVLTGLTFVLSIITYYGVENPFRDRNVMSTRTVLLFTGGLFLLSTSAAFYVYTIGGIVKDYPELALYRDQLPEQRNFFSGSDNIHISYNENVWDLDRDFSETDKIKTLVVGNSFGRDAANLLLESSVSDRIEVRYAEWKELREREEMKSRLLAADRIILAAQTYIDQDYLASLEEAHGITIDRSKVWMLGTKDFGFSNGIHYNRIQDDTDFQNYRTAMKGDVLTINEELREEWGDRYIDLIELLANEEGRVLVFTPDGKFISQDTVHLTRSGARYLAERLQDRFDRIFRG
ncbi:acyltransferase family protein [Neolewinella litorea]|uniref:Acyltransferase n=1 Tax=Neolewinella litorea TaxID=2562452 RepID=A0A4S4NP31_9BACT|nr:acyltransferase family protein [Neolewinella litorea]THH41784.1 acyltransferase [Neolewinella litorea]